MTKEQMQEKMREKVRANSLKYFKNEDLWCRWPILPVKNYKEKDSRGFPLCGVLIAEQGPKVYLINMFQLGSVDIDTVETKAYETFEAMTDDGWEVD